MLTDLRILSLKQYEFLSLSVDEAGRMMGGWKRSLKEKAADPTGTGEARS